MHWQIFPWKKPSRLCSRESESWTTSCKRERGLWSIQADWTLVCMLLKVRKKTNKMKPASKRAHSIVTEIRLIRFFQWEISIPLEEIYTNQLLWRHTIMESPILLYSFPSIYHENDHYKLLDVLKTGPFFCLSRNKVHWNRNTIHTLLFYLCTRLSHLYIMLQNFRSMLCRCDIWIWCSWYASL